MGRWQRVRNAKLMEPGFVTNAKYNLRLQALLPILFHQFGNSDTDGYQNPKGSHLFFFTKGLDVYKVKITKAHDLHKYLCDFIQVTFRKGLLWVVWRQRISCCVGQAGLNLEILLTHCLEQGQKTDRTENYLTIDSVESML